MLSWTYTKCVDGIVVQGIDPGSIPGKGRSMTKSRKNPKNPKNSKNPEKIQKIQKKSRKSGKNPKNSKKSMEIFASYTQTMSGQPLDICIDFINRFQYKMILWYITKFFKTDNWKQYNRLFRKYITLEIIRFAFFKILF